MNPAEARHKELSDSRIKAFTELFGEPSALYPYHEFSKDPDERFPIDVFVYPLEAPGGPIVAAVTSGMSDYRMADAHDPETWARRELIQYFRTCMREHASKLQTMAWLPLFDGFLLDAHHSVTWPHPAIEGTPWRNAFFLEPIIKPHREFRFDVEGDEASLLWHIPISDEERDYKNEHGSNSLLSRMQAVGLPWVFDEHDRPPLLG